MNDDRRSVAEPLRHRTTVVVSNPLGLHMRPASAVARASMKYRSKVTVSKADRTVNSRSLTGLILLAAEMGTELVVEAEGDDAESAVETISRILASPSAEEIVAAM